MAAEKSFAIVLRVREFSETSCVVTLFTRDFGKISALAKGARRPKSPFEAALDLLAVCRIVFLHKSSDALDLLTEAKLERRFRSAGRDLSRLYAGYYVIELLNELTDTADPHPNLFDAADATLAALDGDGPVVPLLLRFELTSLRELGHMPSLVDCVGCGQPVSGTRISFGQLAGGVLCGKCRMGQKQVVSVRREVIEAMRRFADPQNEGWFKVGTGTVVRSTLGAVPATVPDPILNHAQQDDVLDTGVGGELRGLLNHYLSNLLGHRPRMQGYLGMLAKKQGNATARQGCR